MVVRHQQFLHTKAMTKVFDFKTQMAIGDIGENHFCTRYADLAPKKSVERAVDFHLADGRSVELKTDDYPMDSTANFFMEITSHGKLGGPYRAQQDNIDLFVYYFLKNQTFFWFETKTLCPRLDTLIKSNRYKIKIIKNKGWSAEGYAIPRAEFESVLLKKDVFS